MAQAAAGARRASWFALPRFADTRLGQRLAKTVFQPRGPEAGETFLNQRRVFIVPTRTGFLLAGMLVALLLGSINYSLGLGYVLTFMVVGVAWVGMFNTFRNLAHLHLRPARADPVFAGGIAEFRVVLANRSRYDRYALTLTADPELAPVPVDLTAGTELVVVVPVRARRRGVLAMPRIRFETTFPLGLWRAWSYWQPALDCLVWPQPSEAELPLPATQGGSTPGDGVAGAGSEDFAGIRPYIPGDAPRHIAWKAMARNPDGEQLTKMFEGGLPAELWLELSVVPAGFGTEAALSVLTRWVLEAEARQLRYGVRLAGTSSGLEHGDAQRERCLGMLARHPG